mmetsp:Transcript_706/g.1102  ORF Transcript_706/g.1102 Transcript_706/m.1102 type:complete len:300 (-) Transcript_706:41-940(-)
MGQKLTKRLIVPKLTKAMQSYETEVAKDAMSDIARRQAIAKAKGQKYIDPNAQLSGFKRETWRSDEGLPLEARQKDFLTSQADSPEDEMPKDLIDFLNDAGPLERVVDKDFTSKKVYDSLLAEEEQRNQQEQQSRQRKRRRMPIIEQTDVASGDEGALDGTTVERTTNFSQAVKEDKEGDIGMSDQELFDLVSKLQNNETTPETYLSDRFRLKEKNIFTQEQLSYNIDLLENMKRYIGIPVLMVDTSDKSLVGAAPENVETLKLLKVRMAPKNVQLSLNLGHSNEQNKKQILKKAIVLK